MSGLLEFDVDDQNKHLRGPRGYQSFCGYLGPCLGVLHGKHLLLVKTILGNFGHNSQEMLLLPQFLSDFYFV